MGSYPFWIVDCSIGIGDSIRAHLDTGAESLTKSYQLVHWKGKGHVRFNMALFHLIILRLQHFD